ncbi:restriction endonuclease [Carboxylicivirga marina]|uniref:Restriction endonuclease n=1 Tax=Carboxylicivirga marina TaxID=2800988 RepID=A0ABS1HPZ8_9BACT|nr:restriction endonuclease [Carboxylicivirga marina]MBK3519721.1 restriction endonuclease [Carboxylicivirga marina]
MRTVGIINPFTPQNALTNFIGREMELELLEGSLIQKRHKVVAISGNNATGKTSLWRVFLDGHKQFVDKVQVFSGSPGFEGFPTIEKETQLVIIDDISYDFIETLEIEIEKLIKTNPQKQFLLVGAHVDKFRTIKIDQKIHIDNLHARESNNLLNELLKKQLAEKDIQRIANYTKGNPFLLQLFSHYLNQNRYSVDQILKLVNDEIQKKGVFTNSGIEIPSSSYEFKHITSDIRVVNKNILDKIKLRPEDMHKLTSRQFEEMVAELMEKRGYSVDLTKATRDGGKDLIIANHVDIGNFLYYLECKKYAPERPVGVNLIRELAGTISVDRVTAGIMITSSYFSPDAIEFSEKIKHQMSLVDYVKLKEWLKNV